MVILLCAFASCDILKPDAQNGNHTGDNGQANNQGGCQHFFIFGVCRLCSYECNHEWGDGICVKCDCPCKHLQVNEHPEDSCDTCGEKYKKVAYRVALAAEFTSAPECDVYDMDIAMSVDELCAHFIPAYLYTFRRQALDVYINNKLVTDFSRIIDSDVALTYKPKSDALTISVKVEDRSGGSYDIIHLPSGVVTLEMLGALLYPTSGGLEHLLEIATLSVNGVEICDPAYKFNQSCGLTISMKNLSSGGDSYMSEEITITLICEKSGETYEGKVYRHQLVYVSEAIAGISPYNLSDMLDNGYVFVNGVPLTHISNDVRLGENTEIVFKEPADGMLKFSFRALVNPPDFEYKDVFITSDIEPGITYEKIVNEVLGMTWEEYEDKYFNTSHSAIEPGALKPKPIYRDTVISENASVTANYYMESEVKKTVTLNLQFGYGSEHITVPYNTLLSEVLADLGLDIDKCIAEYTVYFNIYHLLSDVRLRFDSLLYIGTNCPSHNWSNQICTLCGARCYQTYYTDTSCSICGSYHPSGSEDPNNPSPAMIKVHVYTFDSDGTEIDYCIKELPYGSDIDVLTSMIWGTLDYTLENGKLRVNEKSVTMYSGTKLYGDEKIEYFKYDVCAHIWDSDSICINCGKPCDHEWKNNVCLQCGDNRTIYVQYEERYDGSYHSYDRQTVSVPYGSSLNYIIRVLGLNKSLLSYGKLYANDSALTNGSITFTESFTLVYKTDSAHNCYPYYKDGICTECERACEHPRWRSSKCTKCKAWCNGDLSHTFVSDYCTNCSCEYGTSSHYINFMYLYQDHVARIPYTCTVREYIAMGAYGFDEVNNNYYFIDAADYGNPNAKKTPVSSYSIIGEFGKNPCLIEESKNGKDSHAHNWKNSVCTVCDDRCKHSFENGVCTTCNCTYIGPDHYVTVELVFSRAMGYVSTFVPASMTLEEFINTYDNAKYSEDESYTLSGGIKLSKDDRLGVYGYNYSIYTD